jgi:hypothetical protein
VAPWYTAKESRLPAAFAYASLRRRKSRQAKAERMKEVFCGLAALRELLNGVFRILSREYSDEMAKISEN